MANRTCPACGHPIIGRIDKKYCSDQCRYLENNKHKHETELPILETNRRLRKNRSILKALCPHGRAVVRKDVMMAMGYDETLFSSLFLSNKKQLYYLCHDYGFTPLIEKGVMKALIISQQPYMRKWDPWKYVRKKTEGAPPSQSISNEASPD